MNVALIFRVVATLLLVVVAFMLLPVIVALYYGESDMLASFLIPMGGVALFAGGYLLLVRPKNSNFSTRSGFLMVTISWIGVSLVGALPVWFSGVIPRYVDCFFEIMSGFTTTGATILTDVEALPMSILFWRSLTHWLGGMGIIVLVVAIFPVLGIGGLQLFKAEAPGPAVDKITPKITETAKILWLTYLIFTASETVLLIAGGMNLFDALTHTFGTLATGGFSPRNASVGHYDTAFIDIIITIFMIAAGINFILYYKFITGRLRAVLHDRELRNYLGILVIAAFGIAIVLHADGIYRTFSESLRHGWFQAASILTTTGYATANFDLWSPFARAILFVLMFIGGCAGSTGGGVKVIRITLLFRQAFRQLRLFLHPRGVFDSRLGGANDQREFVGSIASFVILYLAILLANHVSGRDGWHRSTNLVLDRAGNIRQHRSGIWCNRPHIELRFLPRLHKMVSEFRNAGRTPRIIHGVDPVYPSLLAQIVLYRTIGTVVDDANIAQW